MRVVKLTDVLADVLTSAQIKKLEGGDYADATILIGGDAETDSEEEQEEEEETFGEAADEGDAAAQKKLNVRGKKVKLKEADFGTWVEFEEAIIEAEGGEEEEEENDDDDDWD